MRVSGPLIPYIDGASLELPLPFVKDLLHAVLGDAVDPSTPASIKPFGTLVAIGVYIGAIVTLRRAKERKLNTRVMNDFIFWVVATGFVLSHMLDAIAYHPETVWRDPLYLLKIWAGLSSYGGFIGAAIGAMAWRYYRRQPILEYIDITVSAFPIAWVFGRTGCSVVHDHPGAITDAWFAVQYPNTICPAGFAPDAVCGRYDLGLIEMVLTIPLAAACIYLWKKNPFRASGFYVGVTLTAYAPVRFMLDFLRVDPGTAVFRGATDPRYMGLTPAQWVCFLALFVGVYFLRKAWGQPYKRTALSEHEGLPGLEADADEDEDADDEDDFADSEDAKPRKKKRSKKKARKVEGDEDEGDADEGKPARKKKRSKKRPRKAAGDEDDSAEAASKPARKKRRGKKKVARKRASASKAKASEAAEDDAAADEGDEAES